MTHVSSMVHFPSASNLSLRFGKRKMYDHIRRHGYLVHQVGDVPVRVIATETHVCNFFSNPNTVLTHPRFDVCVPPTKALSLKPRKAWATFTREELTQACAE